MKIKNNFTARNLGSLFFGFMIIASAASCDKTDSIELPPDTLQAKQKMAAESTANSSLLFQSTFESAADLSQWYMENPRANSITRTASPARGGSYAAKFILNKTDPDIWESKRAELTYEAEKKGHVKS